MPWLEVVTLLVFWISLDSQKSNVLQSVMVFSHTEGYELVYDGIKKKEGGVLIIGISSVPMLYRTISKA